jgi:hypothetical protein
VAALRQHTLSALNAAGDVMVHKVQCEYMRQHMFLPSNVAFQLYPVMLSILSAMTQTQPAGIATPLHKQWERFCSPPTVLDTKPADRR